MKKKGLFMFIVPALALMLVTACGTNNDMDPVDDEAPLNEENNNRDFNDNNNDVDRDINGNDTDLNEQDTGENNNMNEDRDNNNNNNNP